MSRRQKFKPLLALGIAALLPFFVSETAWTEEGQESVGADTASMVLIPAGPFLMGSRETEIQEALTAAREAHPEAALSFEDEIPAHLVHVSAFLIDREEVTWEKFAPFAGRTVPPGGAKLPAMEATWDEASSYCRGVGKRLPTEAEWEKAARGTDSRLYPWGNHFDPLRLNSLERNLGRPSPPGSHPDGASPYGVFDMAGNAWEWVADWYEADYYQRAPERDPAGPKEGRKRVVRGGGWAYDRAFVRTANRASFRPNHHHPTIGFRCARSVTSK